MHSDIRGPLGERAAQDGDSENGARVFANRAFSRDPNYHHLVLPDVVAVEADDEEPTCTPSPGDLWCGVVPVGRGSDYFGYNTLSGFGALSDNDFDVGPSSYTISAITVGSQTTPTPGALNFTFDSSTRPTAADRDNLVLHVGGAPYKLSEAAIQGGRSFTWPTAGLDWSRQSYVILRLREASSAERALRGRFVSPPERHDGEKRVKVRVAFSEPVEESPENVGEHGVEVEGGTIRW